jgi:hypothetical protein
MFNVSEKRVDQALEELVFSLYDLDNGTEDYMRFALSGCRTLLRRKTHESTIQPKQRNNTA